MVTMPLPTAWVSRPPGRFRPPSGGGPEPSRQGASHWRLPRLEQVRQAMDDLASREGLRHINLTAKDARFMKTRHGIVPGYNAQSMVS